MKIIHPDPIPNEEGVLVLNQDKFIEISNRINALIISMPDVYEEGKNIFSHVVDSLVEDLIKGWIITSTRQPDYKQGSKGKIIHYYNSKVIAPVEKEAVIPSFVDYAAIDLTKLLETTEGLLYFQALCDTTEDAETIQNTFHRFQKGLSKKLQIEEIPIKVLTAGDKLPYGIVGLNYKCGALNIVCNLSPMASGRSHYVLIDNNR